MNGFRPDIQGLRAIAVAMVVVYHLFPAVLPGGFAGVDVFFVISGYLITGHLWRGYARTGTVDLAGFWGRRARRLIPAAALVLTVTWIAARIVLPATQFADTSRQVLASALYYQNFQLSADAVDYLKSADAATPVQHFWSLSVEEQFYLAWPLVFLLAAALAAGLMVLWATARGFTVRWFTVPWLKTPCLKTPCLKTQWMDAGWDARRAGRTRAGLARTLTAALVAASLAYSAYETVANPSAAYFATPAACGSWAAAASWRSPPPGWPRRWRGRVAWMAGARRRHRLGVRAQRVDGVPRGAGVAPGARYRRADRGRVGRRAARSRAANVGPAPGVHRCALVLAVPVALPGHQPVHGLAGPGPGLLAGPVILAVAVLLAWLTKTFVEDKVRLARFLARHPGRSLSVALAAAVPAVLAVVYLAGQPGPWDGRLGPDYPGAAALAGRAAHVPAVRVLPPPEQISQSLYRRAGCLDDIPAAAPKECVFGDTANPVLTVALVGDSAAGQWFDAVAAIAVRRHWRLVTELHSSCPWTAAVMLNPSGIGTFTACHAWGAAVLRDLVTTIRPDAVITSDYPNVATPGHPVNESPAAMAEIGAGMAQYWTSLERAGISVTADQGVTRPWRGRAGVRRAASRRPRAVRRAPVQGGPAGTRRSATRRG